MSAPPAVPPSSVLLWIPVDQLEDHPTEAVPLADADVDRLVASIRQVGILQPLLVEEAGPDRWRIIDGHHRAAAARAAGLPAVPCQVKRGADASLVGLHVNQVRRVVGPVQQARTFARLRDGRSWSAAQVARHTGYSEAHVSTRLALLQLDEATLGRVEARLISAERAVGAVRRARGAGRGRRAAGDAAAGGPDGEYFGLGHALAGSAAERCADVHGRRAPGRLGGVACGACWEHVIRVDALAQRVGGQGYTDGDQPGSSRGRAGGRQPATGEQRELPNRGGTVRVGKSAPAAAGLAGAAAPAETGHPVPPPRRRGPAVAAVAAGPRPAAPPPPPPAHDEAAVAAFLAGGRGNCDPAGLSRADRLEIARRVLAASGSVGDLAELLDITWDAADRLATAAGAISTTTTTTATAGHEGGGA